MPGEGLCGGEVERVPDMRFRVAYPAGFAPALVLDQGEIDAARIDHGEVEQAAVGQRFDMGEARAASPSMPGSSIVG